MSYLDIDENAGIAMDLDDKKFVASREAIEDLARQLPRLQEECKALWSEKRIDTNAGIYFEKAWQYYLQQMVIAKDPIKYLGRNL